MARVLQVGLVLLTGWLCLLANAEAATFKQCQRIPARQSEAVLQVQAVRILDGDTLDVLPAQPSGKALPYRVRLAEIDAPEKDQPYGKAAATVLSDLVNGKSITLRYRECDRYHRIIGRLTVDNNYIAEVMIQRGAAWFNSQYSDSAELYDIENQARDAKLGLWSLPKHQIIEPWVWRKLSAEERRKIR